jgi:hypothetical protein
MSIKSSKQNHSPMDTLQKYRDKPLYDVPDHYFEQLQHDIMQRVAKEEKRQKSYKKWISAVSIAASIAVIFMLSYFLIENRNPNEPFYVHEETAQPENSVLDFDSTHYAEAQEITTDIPVKSIETPAPLSPKAPLVAPEKETIVYRAVDYYIDDYETSLFCETMYDLECYYDY